jgi:hypothetical protein
MNLDMMPTTPHGMCHKNQGSPAKGGNEVLLKVSSNLFLCFYT